MATRLRPAAKSGKRCGMSPFISSGRRCAAPTRRCGRKNGRTMVLRQLPELIERARAFNRDLPTLRLNPYPSKSRAISAGSTPTACPGSYYTEIRRADDVAAGGELRSGPVRQHRRADRPLDRRRRPRDAGLDAAAPLPDFQPQPAFLDLGCRHRATTSLPFALGLPRRRSCRGGCGGAPCCVTVMRGRSRWGSGNVTFLQANAEETGLPAGSFRSRADGHVLARNLGLRRCPASCAKCTGCRPRAA